MSLQKKGFYYNICVLNAFKTVKCGKGTCPTIKNGYQWYIHVNY